MQHSFNSAGRKLAHEIAATGKAVARTDQALRRAESTQRRIDARGWVMQRRERTRHLIELGGLVQKAGLVDLTDDDRATLYGALLDLAIRGRKDEAMLLLWKRRGQRAFDTETEVRKGPSIA